MAKIILERKLAFKVFNKVSNTYRSNIYGTAEMAWKSVGWSQGFRGMKHNVFRVDAIEIITKLTGEDIHTKRYKIIKKRYENRIKQDKICKELRREVRKLQLIARLEREIAENK